MGIGAFHLADFDNFEVENFNRQFGAKVSTLGRKKVEVVRDEILDINPLARVEVFDEGVNANSIGAFLNGVDLIADGLDFFAFEARDLLFPEAQRLAIPLLTAAPLGFSSAMLLFTHQSMPYQKYFNFKE